MNEQPKKPKQLPKPDANAPAAPVGRPSSFRPEFIEQTAKLCALGATDIDIADFFDVSPRTLNRWKATEPAFAQALRRGKEPSDDRVENSLYHRAQDREVEEEQAIKVKKIVYGSDGKKIQEEEKVEVVTVRKFLPGDTTAMIFWLKNRRSKEWRDVHKHEHGHAGAFDDMDDIELTEYIVVNAQEIQETEQQLLPAPPTKPKIKRTKVSSTQH